MTTASVFVSPTILVLGWCSRLIMGLKLVMRQLALVPVGDKMSRHAWMSFLQLASVAACGLLVVQTGCSTASDLRRMPVLERSGLIVIEAEDADTVTSANPPGFRHTHSWQFGTDRPGYSGRGFMQILPDEWPDHQARGPSSPRNDSGAEMVYHIQIDTPGTYYVWVRGYSMGGESNGVHVGLDDALAGRGPGASNMSGFRPHNRWVWENRRKAEYAPQAKLQLSRGLHTLHLWQRDDGFRIDRILLTMSDDVPTGTGPGLDSGEP